MDNKERQVNNGHRVQDAFYFYQLLDQFDLQTNLLKPNHFQET